MIIRRADGQYDVVVGSLFSVVDTFKEATEEESRLFAEKKENEIYDKLCRVENKYTK
jgi:hypothetical protein